MTRPNILFVFPDQWRGDWIKAMSPDLPLRTPNVDRLIETGVAFQRAWTPSPLCGPARSSLATGKDYGHAPVMNHRQSNPVETDTFYRRLGQAGYTVASLGKSDLFKPDNSWGRDGRHRVQGVDRLAQLGIPAGSDMAGKHDAADAAALDCADPYTARLQEAGLIDIFTRDLAARSEDSPLTVADWEAGKVREPECCYANVTPSPLPPELYADNVVGQAAVDFIGQAPEAAPWFLMVNFLGPHEPMDVTDDMIRRWEGVAFPLPHGRQKDDADLQTEIRRRYAAMLENVDTWLGRMIDELDRRDMLANTVIVFASDHGEMLGDRNLWKKQVPYEPSVRVPLVWAGPGIAPLGQSDHPASLVDIPVTLLSMAQAAPLEESDGFDLTASLGGADYPRTHAIAGLGAWRAITDGRWKLVMGFRTDLNLTAMQFGTFDVDNLDPGRLYDLATDPLELKNLWATCPSHRDRLMSLLVADHHRQKATVRP